MPSPTEMMSHRSNFFGCLLMALTRSFRLDASGQNCSIREVKAAGRNRVQVHFER